MPASNIRCLCNPLTTWLSKEEFVNNSKMTSIVESRLKEGATREEILREVGGTDDAARVIASTPDFKLRQKYAKLNWTLVVIIAYFALLKLVTSVSAFVHEEVPFFFLPTVLFAPGVAIYFAVQIRKFRGGFYLISGLLSISVVLNHGRSLDSVMTGYNQVLVWLSFYGPMIVGAFIAFFLKMKLCPHLGYMGAKTDSAGKYRFLNDQRQHNQEDAPDQEPVR